MQSTSRANPSWNSAKRTPAAWVKIRTCPSHHFRVNCSLSGKKIYLSCPLRYHHSESMRLPETTRRQWEHLGQAPGTSSTGTGFVPKDETHPPCRVRRFCFSTRRSPLASGFDSLHALLPAPPAKIEGKGARASRKIFLKQLEMQRFAQEITHAPMRNAPWPCIMLHASLPVADHTRYGACLSCNLPTCCAWRLLRSSPQPPKSRDQIRPQRGPQNYVPWILRHIGNIACPLRLHVFVWLRANFMHDEVDPWKVKPDLLFGMSC